MRVGTRICFDSNRMSTHSKKEEGTLLTTTDTKTMAYINLFGVLGTLENLCAPVSYTHLTLPTKLEV